eukprot:tig00000254_g22497.t1
MAMRNVAVDLPVDVYRRLEEYAARSGCTIASAAASLLSAALGTSPKQLQATTGAPFDQLPDGILSLILEYLGYGAAALARAVCRRWRAAVEGISWREVVLDAPSPDLDLHALGRLIEGLASGPAARSLKGIRCNLELTGAALRALPRLVALERLQGLDLPGQSLQLGSDVKKADLAALGSCPSLKSVGPLRAGRGDGSPLLAGLTEAFKKTSSFADVDLWLDALPPPKPLKALARAAGKRPCLRADAAAAALADAPPRRLVFVAAADGGDPGRLVNLVAFADCPVDELEVIVRLDDVVDPFGLWSDREMARKMTRRALAAVLPSARFKFEGEEYS